jgi:hypothetical protein
MLRPYQPAQRVELTITLNTPNGLQQIHDQTSALFYTRGIKPINGKLPKVLAGIGIRIEPG